MRALVYFVVWTCVTVSLFITFSYLLTLVDPGLKDIPAKAAKMFRNEHLGLEPTILPPAQYVDFEEFVKKTKKNDLVS